VKYLPFFALFALFVAQTARADDAPQPSALVSTMTLQMGTLPATVTAYGTIAPGEDADHAVTLQGAGIIRSVNVTAGQNVTKGQILADIAPDPQSAAEWQRAQDAVASARANRAHVAALLQSHLATNADLAMADQTLHDAESTLTALRIAGTGTVRSIAAPDAGYVSVVTAAPGNQVPAGTTLFHVVDPTHFVATLGVPPDQVTPLRPGEAATVTLLNSGATLNGVLREVSYVPDPQTGLLGATLVLDAAAPLGAPVKAVIITGTLIGFVVPRDAVQNDENGDYAFQVDAKNSAHRVAVHILGTLGAQTVIAPDLNTTMPLVTVGAYQLSDGMEVRTGAGSQN
jgi:RND family efflux transporter MFP subunit